MLAHATRAKVWASKLPPIWDKSLLCTAQAFPTCHVLSLLPSSLFPVPHDMPLCRSISLSAFVSLPTIFIPWFSPIHIAMLQLPMCLLFVCMCSINCHILPVAQPSMDLVAVSSNKMDSSGKPTCDLFLPQTPNLMTFPSSLTWNRLPMKWPWGWGWWSEHLLPSEELLLHSKSCSS